MAGDKRRCAGGKEHNCACHIHRIANAVQCSNALDHVGTERGSARQSSVPGVRMNVGAIAFMEGKGKRKTRLLKPTNFQR
jgi:hypothetical protein